MVSEIATRRHDHGSLSHSKRRKPHIKPMSASRLANFLRLGNGLCRTAQRRSAQRTQGYMCRIVYDILARDVPVSPRCPQALGTAIMVRGVPHANHSCHLPSHQISGSLGIHVTIQVIQSTHYVKREKRTNHMGLTRSFLHTVRIQYASKDEGTRDFERKTEVVGTSEKRRT